MATGVVGRMKLAKQAPTASSKALIIDATISEFYNDSINNNLILYSNFNY